MLNLQFAGSLTFPDFSLKYSEINLPPTQVLTNLLSSSYCTTAGNSKWIKSKIQSSNKLTKVLTNYHLQSIAQLAKVSQKTKQQIDKILNVIYFFKEALTPLFFGATISVWLDMRQIVWMLASAAKQTQKFQNYFSF